MSLIRRRKFLVVVDETPECRVALRFAARRAEHTGGVVSLAHIVPPPDTQQWAGVEELMRAEAEAEAEATLYQAAKYVFDITGAPAEVVMLEGKKKDALLSLLRDDKAISILVLASGSSREGPGPLVAAAASGASGFPIPVTIVPGTLSDADIDALA
ncbi:MAG: universal stress protein [Alphaproteobacteria bacterium]|jgi:nucleotide-binding universal stress UspA family protein